MCYCTIHLLRNPWINELWYGLIIEVLWSLKDLKTFQLRSYAIFAPQGPFWSFAFRNNFPDSFFNSGSMFVQERALQPTMVLLVPFCPNSDNEALTFLHQWRQHATPVNVAGYLFNSQTQVSKFRKVILVSSNLPKKQQKMSNSPN